MFQSNWSSVIRRNKTLHGLIRLIIVLCCYLMTGLLLVGSRLGIKQSLKLPKPLCLCATSLQVRMQGTGHWILWGMHRRSKPRGPENARTSAWPRQTVGALKTIRTSCPFVESMHIWCPFCFLLSTWHTQIARPHPQRQPSVFRW